MSEITLTAGTTLKGKVCIVTGGSKGIGKAVSERLVAEGASVAILSRGSAALTAASEKLGDAVFGVSCDIADGAAIDAAINAAADHFGRIDAVISNAALVSLLKIETVSTAEIEREFAVNLLGPVMLTRAAIPHLRAAGGGDLIYMSSESVRMPYPFLTLYGAAKGAIETFAAGMRIELRDQGTRVSVLRSGAVEGSSLEDGWDPAVREAFFQAAARMGNAAFSGQPATRVTMAQVICNLLALPHDVNVDMMEVRGR